MSEMAVLSVMLLGVLSFLQLLIIIAAYPDSAKLPEQKVGERGIMHIIRIAWTADKRIIGRWFGYLFTPKTEGSE